MLEGGAKITFGGVVAVVHGARTIGGAFVVDGVRESRHAFNLRQCVGNLIDELVPESRRQMRSAVGLDVGRVQKTWAVTLTQFYLASKATDPKVNPRALHPTFINLYDLVGGFNVTLPPPFGRPRNEMVIAGTSQRPTRDDIDRYLAGDPAASNFRIYPMRRDALDQHIQTAVVKARDIGLHLVFSVREQAAAQWFDARVSIRADPVLEFGLNLLLGTSLGRSGLVGERCIVAAGALVRDDPDLDPRRFGATNFSPPKPLSGLEYRDAWPDHLFRYTLIHEIGHYFGLDHPGHTGPQDIMWTIDREAGLPLASWDTVAELYLSAEPRFTDADACAVWRWILTNARTCIALPNPGPRPPS